MSNLKINAKGFTIVELMIATVVFSLVLVVCAAAITYVGRVYHKGVITNQTQDTARRIMQEVASRAQFSGTAVRTGATTNYGEGNTGVFCVGGTRFTFNQQRALGSEANPNKTDHVLWIDPHGTEVPCAPVDLTQPSPPGATDGSELLGANMRLSNFSITQSGDTVTISIILSYGADPDLFVPTAVPLYSECRGLAAGGQFCAVSTINTSVTQRL